MRDRTVTPPRGGATPADAIFDRVIQILPSGKRRNLSRQEFEELPLSERIRSILSKGFRFYLGIAEVPLKDALKDR